MTHREVIFISPVLPTLKLTAVMTLLAIVACKKQAPEEMLAQVKTVPAVTVATSIPTPKASNPLSAIGAQTSVATTSNNPQGEPTELSSAEKQVLFEEKRIQGELEVNRKQRDSLPDNDRLRFGELEGKSVLIEKALNLRMRMTSVLDGSGKVRHMNILDGNSNYKFYMGSLATCPNPSFMVINSVLNLIRIRKKAMRIVFTTKNIK
jgi:hypothetical protein